jgi:hypothetical protein
VDPKTGGFRSVYHPKDPEAYLTGLETLVHRQVDKLMALS